MQGQPGDFIGQGKTYQLNSANSSSTIYGGTGGIGDDSHGLEDAFRTFSVDQTPWTVDMYPANGAAFTVRTYSNAVIHGPGSSPTRNQLEISGDGRGCDAIHGSFAVKQAAFSASNGFVQHFDATFIQYCDGDTAALTGELKYDAEPVTSAAPVSALKATANSSGVAISWVNPASSRYRYTLVRAEPSGSPAGIAAFAGRNVYASTCTATVAHGLLTGHTYTVAAYAIDQYGNISLPVTHKITV